MPHRCSFSDQQRTECSHTDAFSQSRIYFKIIFSEEKNENFLGKESIGIVDLRVREDALVSVHHVGRYYEIASSRKQIGT